MENPIGGAVPHGVKVKELTNEERETIVCSLLKLSNDGQLPHGTIKNLAGIYHVSCKCISKIWNQSVIAPENGNYLLSVVHNQKKGMTNNLKYDPQALSIALRQLPLGWCGNQRDATRNLDVSRTTI